MKPSTKLEQVRAYFEEHLVRLNGTLTFDNPDNPRALICTTPHHTYTMNFWAPAWSIGYALADNLRREAAGHIEGTTIPCPFCPTPSKETP